MSASIELTDDEAEWLHEQMGREHREANPARCTDAAEQVAQPGPVRLMDADDLP